ncbi:hypothetical protein K503DRAFT_504045 [Rhizopogon vinicolor AM-OR11-026]|uniref:Fe2OG dioxygenase domain-containing protein n=1 Tax=Rhizopogon vinicolor AM-OR11-026 TaxID=1314800 RepID=A0A1B7MM77_9AGAM|nr:hypothetical protein K503DRAFT_504045 [Rhizopogon vinicolor AM-OR11-026]
MMSQTAASQSSDSEHDLSLFKRVHERILSLPQEKEGYKVQTNTKLAHALDKLAGSPFASFTLDPRSKWNFSIKVKGEEAGTLMNPDVSVLQKHATPSPFGRGKETTIDPSYRNGTELKARELKLSAAEHQRVLDHIYQNLTSAMFVGKDLKIKLYKLVIYEAGGHFNWHRDSTHSDAHHGTVLLALNTEWEGGDFMLRHGGVEVNVDMHPTAIQNKSRPIVAAFYTDTEHKVMPVTNGVRLVLQYDVKVIGERPLPDSRYSPNEQPLLQAVWRAERLESGRIVAATYTKPDHTLIQAVIDEIKELHDKGTNIVAFPLFHLYRRASVKREYLKGNDSALFDALKDQFDISVNTVLIYYDTTPWSVLRCVAYRYSTEIGQVQYTEEEFTDEYDDDSDEEESDIKDGYTYRHKKERVTKDAAFHIPRASAIEKILEQQLAELVGSERQKGETRYYGAGIFVKPKTGRLSSVHEREVMNDSDGDEGRVVKKRRVE